MLKKNLQRYGGGAVTVDLFCWFFGYFIGCDSLGENVRQYLDIFPLWTQNHIWDLQSIYFSNLRYLCEEI